MVTGSVTVDSIGATITGGLDAAGDSGRLTRAGITSSESLVFCGRTTADTKVTLSIVALELTETVMSNADGTFHLVTSPGIVEGTYEFMIAAVDATGCRSDKPVAGVVVIDRKVNDFSASFNAEPAMDDHLVGADGPALSGTGEPGTVIKLILTSFDGSHGTVVVDRLGQWQYVLPDGLNDGSYRVNITITDPAGAAVDLVLPITIKTPALGSVVLADPFGSVHNNMTNVPELTFQGDGAEPGNAIWVSVQNRDTGEVIKLDPASFVVTGNSWVYDLPTQLRDGQYTVTFTAADSAGNRSPAQAINVEIATQPPPLDAVFLQDNGFSGASELISHSDSPIFCGSSSKDTTVTIAIYRSDVLIKTGSTLVTREDGSWSAQVRNLSDGHYHWVVTVRDALGNQTRLEQPDQTLTINTLYTSGQLAAECTTDLATRPKRTAGAVLPTIDLPDNSAVDQDSLPSERVPLRATVALCDPDLSADHNITRSSVLTIKTHMTGNTHSVQLTVWCEDGSVDSPVFEQHETLASGTTEHTCTTDTLADGNYHYKSQVWDAAGNRSESSTGTVIINTTPPDPGEINQEGVSDGACVNRADSRFNGMAEPDTQVHLVLTRGSETIAIKPSCVTADDQGKWHYQLPPDITTTLTDGSYQRSFLAVDQVSNISPAQNGAFTLDTVVPKVTVTGLSADTDYRDDLGILLTHAQRPVLCGTVDENAVVTATLNACEPGISYSCTSTSEVNGRWELAVSENIGTGRHTTAVTATELVDNLSQEVVHSARLEIDQSPKNSIDPDSSGTDQQSPQIDSTSHEVSAQACELPIGSDEVHTERTLPTLTLQINGDTGVDAVVANQPEQTFSGTVSGASTLVLVVNDTRHTIAARDDGSWSHTLQLCEGINHVSVTAADETGNKSTIQGVVTIKTRINFQMIQENDSGLFASDHRLCGDKLCFSGRGGIGDTVRLVLTDAAAEEVSQTTITVAECGDWSHAFSDLDKGNYSVTAHISDDAGNTRTETMSDMVIGRTDPGLSTEFLHNDAVIDDDDVVRVAPTFSDLDLPDATGNWRATAVATNSVNTTLTDLTGHLMDVCINGMVSDIPVFTGTAEPGSQVSVELLNKDTNDELTCAVTANEDGQWTTTVTDLQDGRYCWCVSTTDAVDNSHSPAGEFVFSSANVAPPVAELSLVSATADQPLLETRVFTGKGTVNSTVTLAIAGKCYQTTADREGDWVIKAQFDHSGIFNYQLQYQDVRGKSITEQGITTVRMVDFDSLDSPHHAPVTGAHPVTGATPAPVDQCNIDQESPDPLSGLTP